MKYICVAHKNGTTYVPELCDLDEDGTLVMFYCDGVLQLAVPRESFLFAMVVER